MKSKSKIMWIEKKSEENGLAGPARIGRVVFSKSGKSIIYDGKTFQSLKGSGIKANYYDVESGEEYWISGCRKDGKDALYSTDVEIDDDVLEEYWTDVRNLPQTGLSELIQFCINILYKIRQLSIVAP
ncbi:hypothetical protein Dalk_3360 [Desulfatibacillum aliphaticivorans]|uniref:1-deoxy-D-xylulose-5-phosphate synthase n=1 Tax=Desulfatibacillum aliphaticivorans TaxID=218208 RepID=B8FLA3_DESAL|nr:hypothetical protein [Desulfatibacillum aliphaticivorans]ACL05049.1 hypothetical protein Dalk_3360 [Desulfatibacillum aliphaticivorans]